MDTNKKYRLLKDLPGWSIGSIFSENSEEKYCPVPCGYPNFHASQIENNPDWFEEVKCPPEIPKDQAWVVPSTKYRNKEWSPNRYFIPSEFNFSKNHWEGTNTIFGILEGLRYGANNRVPYFKNKYAFQAMTSKDEWEEYVEPEKPKRLAPAYFYYTNDNDISVSQWLFASKEEAIARLGRNFKGWPALPDSDGFYPGPKGYQECTS